MSRLSSSSLPALPLPTFPLGQRADGQWVVRKVTRGLIQRRFADRKQAIRLAFYASGARLAVITTSKLRELEVL